MEMTPVDIVSGTICHLADEPSALGRVFHLTDPNPVSAETVFDWLEEMGYALERLDYPEWLKTLHDAPRRGKEEDVIGSILHGTSPEAYEIWDGNTYDDSNTRRALRERELWRPSIDALLFANYVRYFVEQGWIEAPRNPPTDAGWRL